MKNSTDFDKEHLWHPYSSITKALPMFAVSHAQGVTITLQDGRELIDGMSSWWSAIHGYNHPILNKAINDQLQKMAHIMFGGLTHEPAIELGKRLIAITPAPLQKIFYADSGSVAVEVAIKMAVQYWQSTGQAKKSRIVSFMNAYHGDTFGAMSVTDPINGMHHLFTHMLAPQLFAPSPCTPFGESCLPDDMQDFDYLLETHHQEIAAVIIEPIVQGAGGMKFYSADVLKHIRQKCDEYNILMIADEIATGFGRTGELFGCNHANISPDIMCLGKAITGGYMSFAATLCTNEIAIGISEGETGVFMHGPTFMANPLACAVSIASIDLLLNSSWKTNIQRINKILTTEFSAAKTLPPVANVRILGAIGVIEMHQPVDMETLQVALVNAGVWVRPFGKLVYIMPPFVISNEELALLCQRIITTLKELPPRIT